MCAWRIHFISWGSVLGESKMILINIGACDVVLRASSGKRILLYQFGWRKFQ